MPCPVKVASNGGNALTDWLEILKVQAETGDQLARDIPNMLSDPEISRDQVKALFDVADGHYWLVFRGFHSLLLVCLLLLFTRALRIQSWTDFAAGIFAIIVLTGMHTFRGTVREAFPINHFAEILLFCLLTLNLAQSRGGWGVDVAAAVTFVAASLTAAAVSFSVGFQVGTTVLNTTVGLLATMLLFRTLRPRAAARLALARFAA